MEFIGVSGLNAVSERKSHRVLQNRGSPSGSQEE
jgi:hypothetical protein